MKELTELRSIVDKYGENPEYILEALHDIQSRYRHVPEPALDIIAERMKVKKSRVFSLVSFYKALSFEPQGEKNIRVCMGTACHLKGASQVKEEIEAVLDVAAGETTADGRYSLHEVNCVGACSMAPVVIIGDSYEGQATRDRVRTLLDNDGSEEESR